MSEGFPLAIAEDREAYIVELERITREAIQERDDYKNRWQEELRKKRNVHSRYDALHTLYRTQQNQVPDIELGKAISVGHMLAASAERLADYAAYPITQIIDVDPLHETQANALQELILTVWGACRRWEKTCKRTAKPE